MSSPSRMSIGERALARIGTEVRGCRIERLLGIGGMAQVYAATHHDGRRVAIKFLLEHHRDDENTVHLFRREAMVANQVGHAGAVPVLEHDVDGNGCPFLMMPLLEGETFRARWEQANGRLPVSEVGALMHEVLDVLASAHARSIVHRDIKPENLFLTTAGHVRVLDFGIARRIGGDGTSTTAGLMLGTPAYMPPEQALADRKAIGPHSDCWAAGATIFTLLSGQFVHAADGVGAMLAAAATEPARSLATAAPNLPLAIVQFVDRALAFDRHERFRDAGEMRDALRAAFEAVTGQPLAAEMARIRAVADSLHAMEETHMNVASRERTTPRREAKACRVDMAGVEVYLEAFRHAFPLIPASVHAVFAKHGIGEIDDRGEVALPTDFWCPLATYIPCLHETNAVLGHSKTVELARHVTQYFDVPEILRDIHSALQMMDAAYHLLHRRNGEVMFDPTSNRMIDGIGHMRYRGEPGNNLVAIESTTPYPCDIDRGQLVGYVRKFEPHAIVEHSTGPCRQNGADHCIYDITWW